MGVSINYSATRFCSKATNYQKPGIDMIAWDYKKPDFILAAER